MIAILSNIHFWLIIAFSTMVIILFKTTHKILNNLLIEKIDAVKLEIDKSSEVLNNATDLLAEATNSFAQLSKKQEEYAIKLKNIDDNYYERNISHLNNQIKNSKATFADYISTQEKISEIQIKRYIVDSSIEKVVEFINTEVSEDKQVALIDKSIDALPNFLKK